MNEVISLELAIVRLNAEIFDAKINNQPQTHQWLTERLKAVKAKLESVKSFKPLSS